MGEPRLPARTTEVARSGGFFCQRAALVGAKAMLLVDNNQCEVFKLQRLLYERVRADNDRYLALCHPLQELRARNCCSFTARRFGGEFVTTTAGD